MIYGFITMPNATTTYADAGVWSSATFDAFLEPALAVAGMFIAGVVFLFLLWNISDIFESVGDFVFSRHKSPFDLE